jgi:hypothetical protein
MPLARSPQAVEFGWPAGLARIPDEEWTCRPLDEFGLRYYRVGGHGY